jgi:hypothetical protein
MDADRKTHHGRFHGKEKAPHLAGLFVLLREADF